MTDSSLASNRPLIEATNVSKAYGTHPALMGVSLSIQPGEIVGLVGPNGAGKTTLVNLLVGIMNPDGGSVERNVRPHNIGWCPQTPVIDWFLTVKENVRLGATIRGRSRSESEHEILELLETYGLREFADKTPEILSGGQQQRMLAARAIAGSPECLLLDEPTVGLDPTYVEHLLDYLRERSRHGAGVLIVSHDLYAIEALSTKILVLSEGRFVAEGSPRDVVIQLGVGDIIQLVTEPNDDPLDDLAVSTVAESIGTKLVDLNPPTFRVPHDFDASELLAAVSPLIAGIKYVERTSEDLREVLARIGRLPAV